MTLEQQVDELKRIIVLLVARTGSDRVTVTAQDMLDVPSGVQIATWSDPFTMAVTVAISGMPQLDGIVDAEWTEDAGPKAIGA